MEPVEAVLVGGGNRGAATYGGYARAHPERLRIAALAEPVAERRDALAARHGLGPEQVFADWRELLDRPQLAPAAIVSEPKLRLLCAQAFAAAAFITAPDRSGPMGRNVCADFCL